MLFRSGAKDPTQLRDPGAGLSQARQNMVRSLNSTLRANGYTGSDFDIADVTTKQGVQEAVHNTPEEQATQDLSTKRNRYGASAAGDTNALFSGDYYKTTPEQAAKLRPLIVGAVNGNDAANAAMSQLLENKNSPPAAIITATRAIDPQWMIAADPEAAAREAGKRLLGRFATDEIGRAHV